MMLIRNTIYTSTYFNLIAQLVFVFVRWPVQPQGKPVKIVVLQKLIISKRNYQAYSQLLHGLREGAMTLMRKMNTNDQSSPLCTNYSNRHHPPTNAYEIYAVRIAGRGQWKIFSKILMRKRRWLIPSCDLIKHRKW